jgi:transposase
VEANLSASNLPGAADTWLQQAATSSLAVFQRLAQSFQRDAVAITAGITLPWSSGPVEGHINRLKMLKRHMFGRAHLNLLSRRFVWAPQTGPSQAPSQPAPVPAHQKAAAA